REPPSATAVDAHCPAAREGRIGEVRHTVGADALRPVEPLLLLRRRELLAARPPPLRRQGVARRPRQPECRGVRVHSPGAKPVAAGGVTTGSGKFVTPWLRMHSAYASALASGVVADD